MIKEQIVRFVELVKGYLELRFLVTEIDCGIIGHMPEEVAPLFEGVPENVVLPKAFLQ